MRERETNEVCLGRSGLAIIKNLFAAKICPILEVSRGECYSVVEERRYGFEEHALHKNVDVNNHTISFYDNNKNINLATFATTR